MYLYDEAKIYVKAGDGGNGVIAFRREKFVPRGGPAGGHGGNGGNVILQVDPQINTLVHFKNQSHYRASKGVNGGGKNMAGANGDDIIVPVPPGTIIYHAETKAFIADLTSANQTFVVARGGKGGRGNTSFKSSQNQAPRIAEKGLPGEEMWLNLELKLLADVGLLGMPNAGKSTLLSVVSKARPKIADYPFTTLQPNLGVIVLDHRDLVMADIPGLIEGAHTGAGLGHQFLRHVERSRFLIHLLDGASPNPLDDFDALNQELALFDDKLARKPQIMVLNKIDLPTAQEHWNTVSARAEQTGLPAFKISAVTQEGLQPLIRELFKQLAELPEEPLKSEQVTRFTLADDPNQFKIERVANGWRVTGTKIEELAHQTLWDIDQAVTRTHFILQKIGVHDALREVGVEPGDTVYLHNVELEWAW